MEHKYNISFLLPTRGRTTALQNSVQSLVETASEPSKIQIMFGFDTDDESSYEYFCQEIQPWLDDKQVGYTALKFKPMGYINLHKYSNKLAEYTDSHWLVIWNDDTIMHTQGWDTVIMSYTGQFKLLAFHTHRDHPYSIFPIVPRKWYELLGYISPHPTQDGWVSQQAYMLDIWERIEVTVEHDRFDLTGNNKDETFANRPMLEGNPANPYDFHSQQMMDLRHRDCARLATHMRDNGISTEFFENILKGVQDPWEKLKKNDVNQQMMQFDNPHKPR